MNRREFMTNSLMVGVGASVARAGFAAQPRPGDRIAVGLIGSGARGQQVMQEAARLPGVDIVAVCDAYSGRAERARARTNGKATVFADYPQMLDSRDADAVFVATPDHWHKTMTIDGRPAGNDVYAEKQRSDTMADGQPIINAVREK